MAKLQNFQPHYMSLYFFLTSKSSGYFMIFIFKWNKTELDLRIEKKHSMNQTTSSF
jgi:hypothetical protein